jgi:hypothetical protein
MIASAYPHGAGWAWEVLGTAGQIVATGHASTPEQARRMSTRAWLQATSGRRIDLADMRAGQVCFGGAWGR